MNDQTNHTQTDTQSDVKHNEESDFHLDLFSSWYSVLCDSLCISVTNSRLQHCYTNSNGGSPNKERLDVYNLLVDFDVILYASYRMIR